MKFRSLMTAICVLAAAQIVSAAPFAYIANSGTKNVSVIDTATNLVTATVTLQDVNGATLPNPYAYSIAVGASGQYVYVGVQDTNEVQVIDTATNTVVKNITLGTDKPGGLAVNAAETRLYVAVNNSNTLRVINIAGSGAVEVGRVSVDDVAQSVPEGVVLNPAGNKAYVANSADGRNSIAEIALDEATNTYTRTLLIPLLPAGTRPFGLAISTDGSKLYFSSFNGNAGVVDTSTKAVTSMATDLGNLSIAVNPAGPDAGKVYTPSNAMDRLYAFDAAGAFLGPYVSAATGPRGVSVNPAGTKLFVAMNLDDKVKVYDTANLATAPAAIDLTPTAGAGAKPNSLGNFIGPVWGNTIAATATSPCTISPSGAVPVNSHGWTFAISGAGCDVKVNGASVGMVSSWQITDVTDNSKTIDASQVGGTYYTVSCDWISSVGGYLVSTPEGISEGSKSAQFPAASTVELNAPGGFTAINWTGDCAGTANGVKCTLPNIDGPRIFGATVIAGGGTGPVKNVTKDIFYQTIDAAIAAAATNDDIRVVSDYSPAVQSVTTSGTAAIVKVSCGWNDTFTSQTIPAPAAYALKAVTITGPGLIVDNMVI